MIGITDSNQKIVTDGLVLHLDAAQRRSYPTSGTTWTDLSGNANNGTLTNGPTYNSANGGSIVFDGVDDYVTIPNTSILKPSLPLTISVIQNIVTLGNGYVFTNNGSSTNYSGVSVLIGGVRFGNNGGSGVTSRKDYYFDITLNTWQFITVVCNSVANPLIYINGQLANITATSGTATTVGYSNSNIEIARRNIGGFYVDGSVANVLLYNRALSATEVLQNYNAVKSRFGL